MIETPCEWNRDKSFEYAQECIKSCQLANQYGVWPERYCSPRCCWIPHVEKEKE